MFDQRDLLQERLRPVIRTLQGLRFWRGAAIILLIAALISWALLPPVRSGQISGSSAAWSILAAVAIGMVIIAIAAARSYLDLHDLALRIERRFPSLGQRLLTAVELPPKSQAPLGYLQSRVIEEAREHSQTHRWAEVVSPTQVLISRLAGMFSFVAMAAMLWILATSEPTGGAARGLRSDGSDATIVRIEPGNVELERGTSLIVTAHFPGIDVISDQTELVCVVEDGSERRYPMKQTLDDPILSAFVASVNASLRYQVVSEGYQSEIFTAEVFDYPTLTRADAELTFPEYTGMQPKRIEDTNRVTAVEGTQLLWELNLNKPVDHATLVDSDGNRIELQVSSELPTRYLTNLEMTQTQRWRLELVDAAGRENKFPPELVARVLHNEPPTLKVVAGGDASVSPLEEFPVAVEVQDDFGVLRYGVSYLFPGGHSAEVELGQSVPRGRKQRGDYLIDFESLAAKPDQLLAYHFWAEDIAADGHPRRVQGDLHFAEVRPLEEIYRENESPDAGSRQSQQQQQQGGGGAGAQAEELAELQKQIINATWKIMRRELGPQRSAEFSADLESVLRGQRDAVEQLTDIASQVDDEQSVEFVEQATEAMRTSLELLQLAADDASTEPLTEAVAAQQTAYQALLGLRAREFQVSRSRQNQQQSSRSASQRQRQQQLNDLELKNDENRYESQSQARAEETQQEGREQREVIDRLRELAQRQEDINQQVAQLQSALELAQTEEEKQEIQRQLKRLRDQQQEMLRDADELTDRMQQAQTQSRAEGRESEAMQNATEQLEQTRENLRQASEALQRNDASEALAAGTRAERELDQVREELRQQAAGNFDEAMRQIRSAAQQLDEQQQQITQQMNNEPAQDRQPGLRAETPPSDVVEELQAQRQRLSQLLEQVQETVQQAESSEPLLAQNLYDTYRNVQQQQVDRKLSDTAELFRRGLRPQAETLQAETGEAITNLRERLEQAAEAVLGDQTKALERALGELEQLQEQLDREIEEATGARREGRRQGSRSGESQPSSDSESQQQPNRSSGSGQASEQSAEPQADQPSDQAPGQSPRQGGEPGETQAGEGQAGQQSQGQPRGERQPGQSQAPGQESSDQQSSEQSGESDSAGQRPGGRSPSEQQASDQPASGRSTPGQQTPGQPTGRGGGAGGLIEQLNRNGEPEVDSGEPRGLQDGGEQRRGGVGPSAPLTGEGYRQWSDRLRDVEQMIEDPALRSEATRIRERARETRGEFRRHSQPPQWDEVEETIARPLRELTKNVAQELLRRSADRHAVVPIDRDPVPERFNEAVRQYYESLGSGL